MKNNPDNNLSSVIRHSSFHMRRTARHAAIRETIRKENNYMPYNDDLKKLAKANLTEFDQTNRRAIEGMIEEAGNLLMSNRDTEKARAEQLMRQIDAAYGTARKNSNNDALKRGLARSSIAVNRTADIETAAAEKRSSATAENLANLADIDNRLASLAGKRENALNQFDIAYAARLTQEINNLTQEREKRDMDRALNQSRLDTEALRREELSDSINASRETAEKARRQEEDFAAAFNRLSGMSARDARHAVRNDLLLREQLTPSQFFRLYDRFGR